MISITLIGSTGSIGRQVCNVVRRYPDRFRFYALVANRNAALLSEQVAEFRPDRAVLLDGSALSLSSVSSAGARLQTGEENALECVDGGDVAFVAATGFAGLKYSLRAIAAGKRLALANKETLVCGGQAVMAAVREKGIDLVPVDSEHSALWQALHFDRGAKFSRLVLTASGGPFYGYSSEALRAVTPEQALRHPTWRMGEKITIDSATLLNKGFEVIEAHWLYDAPFEKIEGVVQPESIVHSMASFADGSVLAQMSYPTMEVPIQLALTYPERLDCGLRPLDFASLGALHFKPFAAAGFSCYDLALTAGAWGDNYPCALNAAGEVAVAAFLNEKIGFTQIAEIIEETLHRTVRMRADTYGALCEADRLARKEAEKIVANVL